MPEPRELTPAEGAARAEGSAVLGGKANLTATGAAAVMGDLWLTWPGRDKVGPVLADFWFYGATSVKALVADGAARAAGEAFLIT